jgi:hypothetical protein
MQLWDIIGGGLLNLCFVGLMYVGAVFLSPLFNADFGSDDWWRPAGDEAEIEGHPGARGPTDRSRQRDSRRILYWGAFAIVLGMTAPLVDI